MTQIAINHARKRGRPQGTGIDDRTLLVQLAGILKANRELKPTAAIRSIGITDASIIRRLRNKLKQTKSKAPHKKVPQSRKKPIAADKTRPSKTTTPLKNKQPSIKSVVPAKSQLPQKAKHQTIPPPSRDEPQHRPELSNNNPNLGKPHQAQPEIQNPNVDVLKLTLETAVAMSRIQRQLFDQAIANTPLGLIYKSQAMFAEFIASAMLSHQVLFRKSSTDPSK